jgi:hypothetical protein
MSLSWYFPFCVYSSIIRIVPSICRSNTLWIFHIYIYAVAGKWVAAAGQFVVWTALSMPNCPRYCTFLNLKSWTKPENEGLVYIYIYIYIYVCMYVFMSNLKDTLFFICAISIIYNSEHSVYIYIYWHWHISPERLGTDAWGHVLARLDPS